MTIVPAGTEVAYTVTFLEMTERPSWGYPHLPASEPAQLLKAEDPPVWYFLSLYANAAGTQGTFRTDSTDVLDRYILAKTHDLLGTLTTTMDDYDLFAACGAVRSFLDALTNWYVRRSRDRFWAGDQAAIDTLHTVLSLLCRALAPLLPLTTEAVYQALTGERSVHLTDWPEAASVPADADLVQSMDLARDVCSSALRLRKARPEAFTGPESGYLPLATSSGNAVAFARTVSDRPVAITVVTRLALALDRLGGWDQHTVALPDGDWHDLLSDRVVSGGPVALSDLLDTLPVALLVRAGEQP